MWSKNNKYIKFNGKCYFFDYNKIKEISLSTSKDGGSKEFEISQAYETDDDGELKISSKVEHETRTFGNQQNDMIIYDFLKLLIVSLLENGQTEKEFRMDFGTAITMNTLINWGVLVEAEEEK